MTTIADNWIGASLSRGRYTVRQKLGEGGMGLVYLAWDNNLGQEVVIKVPRLQQHDGPAFAQRFNSEIRSLVQLSHPHVVKVLDVGEAGGHPFAVIQYLAGGSLESKRVRQPNGAPKPISPKSLALWLPKIADALDFVHSQGYVHRDVKPANILFDRYGNPFLSDFGVARVLNATEAHQSQATGGLILGTPEFMAPELVLGLAVDGRVDQYALAITVYELVTGRLPFDGPTPAAIFLAQTTRAPQNPRELNRDLTEGFSQALLRALAKMPSDRFAKCAGMADALCGSQDPVPLAQPELRRGHWTPIVQQRAECPGCGRSMAVSDRARGARAKCPACNTTIEVSADGQQLFELISGEYPVQPKQPMAYRLTPPQTVAVTPAGQVATPPATALPPLNLPETSPSATPWPTTPSGTSQFPSGALLTPPQPLLTGRTIALLGALAVGLLGIIFAVAYSTAPQGDKPTEAVTDKSSPIASQTDALAEGSQLLQAWRERFSKMQKSLRPADSPVLKSPNYANSAELQSQLIDWIQDASLAAIDEMQRLESDMVALRRTLRDSIAAAQRGLDKETQLGSQGDPALLSHYRGLIERVRNFDATAVELHSQLETIQQTLASGAIQRDPSVQREVEVLREMEKVVASSKPLQLTPDTRSRVLELMTSSRNSRLQALVLSTVARTGEKSAVEPIRRFFTTADEVAQGDLCKSLLLSNEPTLKQLAIKQLLEKQSLAERMDRIALLSLLELNPTELKSLVPRIAQTVQSAEERLKLLNVQCQLRDDRWLPEVEQLLASEVLKDHVTQVTEVVLNHKWQAAYAPLVAFVARQQSVTLTEFPAPLLANAIEGHPPLAAVLTVPALQQGNAALRKEALRAYLHPQVKVDDELLRTRLKQGPVHQPTELVSVLMTESEERVQNLTMWVLAEVKNIAPDKIIYQNIPRGSFKNVALLNAFMELAWRSPGEGQSWAINQILGDAFASQFMACREKRNEQTKQVLKINDVLSGKLVAHRYADGTFASDMALQITSDSITRLDAYPAAPWVADGEFAKSLTALQATVAKARTTADPRFDNDLGRIELYLTTLDELTKCTFEVARIYTDTITRELPVANREIAAKNFAHWGFRFKKTDRDAYSRVRNKFNDLAGQLDLAHRALPLFLRR